MREYRTDSEYFNITTDGDLKDFDETRIVAFVPKEDEDQMC